ncbi:MAG: Rrf2 family transcriptional regulator [Clostridiales bacterium]|nr:Rrf2 family transcriptional regulator [Clostridiales bacterium]
MMISTKGRYALRVMIDIGTYAAGEFISLRDVAKRQEISLKYLEQVVSVLNKAGFVRSMRGNNGGYQLAVDPNKCTAGDIIRCMEGSLAPVSCLQNDENYCVRKETCVTLPFWSGLNDVVNDYVDSVTLQELIDRNIALNFDNYSI